MTKKSIVNLYDYLQLVEEFRNDKKQIHLYRGQNTSKKLLPSVAREDPLFDSTKIERSMLEDLKRRSSMLISKTPYSDWDWLVYAQHYGLKTRLLDWTSNPLIALWFACANQLSAPSESVVYFMSANEKMLVKTPYEESPFDFTKTRILRPTLNNERIVAQSGWFTVHKFSRSEKRFIELEAKEEERFNILEVKIAHDLKPDLVQKLSNLGVNNRTIYPDITGLCYHLNWKYLHKISKTST